MWEPCNCEPWEPCRKKKKLDAFLAEVFKQFISIKDHDSKRAQEVFHNVFDQVKQKMKEKSNYFQRYCTEVLYGGSVYDGTKVGHMDEFDKDIVIGLPINYNDITLENDQPGFLRLKITDAFDNLDKQQDWEKYHKVTRNWRDSDKYLLQNKMRQWLQGIVASAIYELDNQVVVNGTIYVLTYKESGPACTLQIRNSEENEEFRLDIDLVPVIKFTEPTWPEGYKLIHSQQLESNAWFVVPKPNKAIQNEALKSRCWRLSFQIYEKEMMRGSHILKTTIRLVKKLRDSLELKRIASYYIKTLFLWEIDQAADKKYWCQKLSVTFRGMVEKLYRAVKDRKIMYFWQPNNNLLKDVSPTLLHKYEIKLQEALGAIYSDDCEGIAGYLLTRNELAQFKSSEFYMRYSDSTTIKTSLTKLCSAQVSIQPPQPFLFGSNSENVTSAWERWKRSFKIFYEASELSKKEKKVQVNILLHVIGEQCQEVYHQFSEELETVDDLFQKFDEEFLPKENLIQERHNFFARNQKDSESIEQYVFELKKIATKCDFKDLRDDLIRDRLICGIKDGMSRERLLREVDLTSSKAIDICRQAIIPIVQAVRHNTENAVGEVRENNDKSNQTTADNDRGVNRGCGDENRTPKPAVIITPIAGETSKPLDGQCFFCGTKHRYGRCPAYGQKCSKCKRMNHLAEVCRSWI